MVRSMTIFHVCFDVRTICCCRGLYYPENLVRLLDKAEVPVAENSSKDELVEVCCDEFCPIQMFAVDLLFHSWLDNI